MQIRDFITTLLLIFVATAAGSGCSRSIADADPALFPDPPDDAITFWGHACFYIDVGGYGIVTDPVFDKRALFRYRKKPAPPPSNYQDSDLVLISHAHSDHLSTRTLKTFPDDVTILCPGQSAEYLEDLGRDVRVMAPGDEFAYPGGRVVAVRAYHTGGQWGIRASDDGRAIGYVIYTPGSRIYYSGDTNYFRGIDDIGIAHRPDVAILNINGHLHGTDAVLAAYATVAPVVIPAHFGVYGFFFFGEQERPRDYDEIEGVLEPVLQLLELGESATLDGRQRLTQTTNLP
jgi:L-ascorbate metabolism protein UlaG (beta-lactamase superfamily)